MLSVKRSADKNGINSFVVECRVPDGKRYETKSRNFKWNGIDELDAQTMAVWFVMATDSLLAFRAFLFGEPDKSIIAKNDGTASVEFTNEKIEGPSSRGFLVGDFEAQDNCEKSGVRSFVLLRQKQSTGPRYAVAICRTKIGQLRAISFCSQGFMDDEEQGTEDNHALEKAVQFLRSAAFESWREQGASGEHACGFECTSGRERGLKHPYSYVEIEQGEKVDCVCGKNRSHGLMMACERCGAWEHAECQGFRSNKQIPADYICSACVRAEREEVIVIRLEEQGNWWNTESESLWTDIKAKEQEHQEPVCCVCGCEDNEGLESLIQACTCDGGSSVGHMGCATAAKLGALQREQRGLGSGLVVCPVCGAQGTDETGFSEGLCKRSGSKEAGTLNNISQINRSSRCVKADQATLGRKRLRSALASGGAPVKGEPAEKRLVKSKNERDGLTAHPVGAKFEAAVGDSKKPSVPLLGRRFSDAAATVPIKKRRLQLEVARSPSPPPRKASPLAQSEIAAKEEPLFTAQLNVSQNPDEVKSVEVAQADVSSPAYDGNFSITVGCEKRDSLETLGVEGEEHQLKEAERDSDEVSPLRRGGQYERVGLEALSMGRVAGIMEKRLGAGSDEGDIDMKFAAQGSGLLNQDSIVDSSFGRRKGEVQLGSRNRGVINTAMQPTPAQEDVSDSFSEEGQTNIKEKYEVPACGISISCLSETGDAGLQVEQALSVSARGVEVIPSDPSMESLSEDERHSPSAGHPRGDEEGSSSLRLVDRDVEMSIRKRATSGSVLENDRTMDECEIMNSGTVSTSGRSSCMRDDRLHWDLNMDMEEWERPSEENMVVDTDVDSPGIQEVGEETIPRNPAEQVLQQTSELSADLTPEIVSQCGTLEQGRLERLRAGMDTKSTFHQQNRGSSKHGMEIAVELNSNSNGHVPCERNSFNMESAVLRETQATACSSMQDVVIHVHEQSDSDLNQAERACTNLEDENGSKTDPHEVCKYEEVGMESVADLNVRVPAYGESTLVSSSFLARGVDGKAPPDLDEIDMNADGSCPNVPSFLEGGHGSFSVLTLKGLKMDCADETIASGEAPLLGVAATIQHGGHSHEDIVDTAVEPTNASTPCKACSDKEVVESAEHGEAGGPASEYEKVIDKEVSFLDKKQSLPSPRGRSPLSQRWEGDTLEELEAENVDYDDSDFREGDELESEDRPHCGGSQAESRWDSTIVAGVSSAEESKNVDGQPWKPGTYLSQNHRSDSKGNTKFSSLPSKRVQQSCSIVSEDNLIHRDSGDAHASQTDAGNSGPLLSTTIEADANWVAKTEEGGDLESHQEREGQVSKSDHHRRKEANDEKDISTFDGKIKSEICKRGSEGTSRVKSSGWDQLPEGFDKAEDALRAAREVTGRVGRGSQYWSGPGGWNASVSTHYSSNNSRFGSGHGRGPLWRNETMGERMRPDDIPWRDEHGRGRGVDEDFGLSPRISSAQELRQGRGSRARGSLKLTQGRSRRDPWGDAPPGVWGVGPIRHLSPPGPFSEPVGFSSRGPRNAAAAAAAKVESSGFVVAPDGTIIKAGSPVQASHLLGGGGRGGHMFGMGGMGSPGVGVTGLGGSMRIGGDMGPRGREIMGMGPGVPPGMGIGMGIGIQGPGAPLRCEVDRFGGSYISGGGSVQGMPVNTSGDGWSRGDRGVSSPGGQRGRISPVRRRQSGTRSVSQPRSRSRSPRVRTPPRPVTSNSLGSGDVAAASQSRKRSSLLIINTRAESRPESCAEKSEESPSHRFVPQPPKLPLPPPPPRGQRSPPAGLKRLSTRKESDWPRERERERDKEKERDWDRERPGLRVRTPPRRTSPHVVHGSALTDERDRQLLAGITQESPPSRLTRPSEPSLQVPVSRQDSSTTHTLRGKSPEVRRLQGDEVRNRDTGAHLPRKEEFLGKGGDRSRDVSKVGSEMKDRRLEASSHRDGGKEVQDKKGIATGSDTHRDGRKPGGSGKYSSSWEGDDDVAPRRRRPSS